MVFYFLYSLQILSGVRLDRATANLYKFHAYFIAKDWHVINWLFPRLNFGEVAHRVRMLEITREQGSRNAPATAFVALIAAAFPCG
jgi:hypothetical protein